MKGNFNRNRMKKSVKVALIVLFLAVGSGLTLTYCSRSEKPVADQQDTTRIDTVQNPVDTTAQDAAQDTAAVN
jgi:hypothetical protein